MKTLPDAILVGDIHLRDDQPRCRLDDFLATQKRKGLALKELWEDMGRPPVLQPGDVFDRWKASPQTINLALLYFPPMFTIVGNPGKHNYQTDEGFEKDALSVVRSSYKNWTILKHPFMLDNGIQLHPCLWGKEPIDISKGKNGIDVLITHRNLLDGPSAYDGEDSRMFLEKCSTLGYNLVLSGHNHKPFVKQHGRSLLINPGSFTRQSASEDHRPKVYLWYAKTNTVEAVYIPIEEGVISRDHIDEPKVRDERIEAFVKRLDQDLEISINFKDNVLSRLSKTKIRDIVTERIMEAVDES